MPTSTVSLPQVLLLAIVVACDGGSPSADTGSAERPTRLFTLHIDGAPSDPEAPTSLIFDRALLQPGDSVVREVTITNSGMSELTVSSARFEFQAPNLSGPFSLRAASIRVPDAERLDLPLAGSAFTAVRLPPGAALVLTLEYVWHAGPEALAATFVLETNADPDRVPTVRVPMVVPAGTAVLALEPSHLDFGVVPVETAHVRPLTAKNVGVEVLVLEGINAPAETGFDVLALGAADLVKGLDGHSWRFEPPRRVAPGDSAIVHVHYYAANAWTAHSALTVVPGEGVPTATATAVANGGDSCLRVEPESLSFGANVIGQTAARSFTLSSCGGGPVELRGIGFTPEASLDFAWELGDDATSGSPSAAAPWVLESGQQRTIHVTFAPSDENPLDGGVPVLDSARLRIQTDETAGYRDVPLSGFGTSLTCPVAVGGFKEGVVVPPLTKLHLRAHQSWAPPGRTIAKHRWTVTGPVPDVGVPFPAATYAHPTFELRGVGVYTFSLEVWDDAGTPSCTPWIGTVTVTPPTDGMWVELTWSTPGDLDESDLAGANLDLHFAHLAYAAPSGYEGVADGQGDPWYDQPFDCHAANRNPNWGALDPGVPDDPSFDRADPDGVGPELLSMPDSGSPAPVDYALAVHYRDDGIYGDSWATLRIFVDGAAVYERAGVRLSKGDLWQVGLIRTPTWAIDTWESPEGGDDITADYAPDWW